MLTLHVMSNMDAFVVVIVKTESLTQCDVKLFVHVYVSNLLHVGLTHCPLIMP